MNKSVLLGLLLFLTILSSTGAFAVTKTLHSAWHEYVDTFTVDERVVNIRVSESADYLLRVSIDNMSALINYDDCKEIDIYTVCYVNMSYDVAQTTISDSGKTMPAVRLNISYEDLTSDLQITNALSKFNVYQEYKVNVTFTNKKNQWLESFTYEVTLPQGVSIVDKGDFTITGQRKLAYTGSLSSEAKETVSYRVIADSAGVKKVNYTLNISSQELSKTAKGNFNFNVVSPYTLTATFTPSTVNVLDTSKLLITVKNTGKEDLILKNLTIEGPGDLEYTAGRGLNVYYFGKYYSTTKETILPGKGKEYYMIVTPSYLGKYNFTVKAYMDFNGEEIVGNVNKTLISSAGGFMPVFILSKDAVISGGQVEVLYSVENTNSDNTFKDITAKISGGFVSENTSLSKLNTVEEKILIRKFLYAPYVDKDVTYRVTAVTDYYTAAGEKKQINTSRNLKVTSNGSILSLTHKLSSKEVYVGEELIVELNVKNMKDEVFQVGTMEILPQGVTKVGGVHYRNFTMKGLVTESAYVYKLVVPSDSSLTSINITSIAGVDSKAYVTNYTSVVKVKRNATASSGSTGTTGISGGVSGTDTKGNNVTVGIDVKTPAEDVKEDGKLKIFFRKINTFFTNLFS